MENNENKNFCLYTLFNDNYFEQGTNLIYSFLVNNTWFNGDIIVLCDDGEYCGLSEEHRGYIKMLYTNLYFANINHNDYNGIFDTQKNFGRKQLMCCFYKYEIFKDNKYDKKLYLDSDIIVTGDVRELFFNDVNFGACLDMAFDDREIKVSDGKLILDYRDDKRFYFNGGVYIVDKHFCEQNAYDEIFKKTCLITKEDFSKNPKVIGHGAYVDQDCLNLILKNEDVVLFPNKIYNCNPYTKNINEFKKSKIKHFYWGKPWQKTNIDSLKDAYSDYYFYTYWKNKDFNF